MIETDIRARIARGEPLSIGRLWLNPLTAPILAALFVWVLGVVLIDGAARRCTTIWRTFRRRA